MQPHFRGVLPAMMETHLAVCQLIPNRFPKFDESKLPFEEAILLQPYFMY